jgi:hypothetical protein
VQYISRELQGADPSVLRLCFMMVCVNAAARQCTLTHEPRVSKSKNAIAVCEALAAAWNAAAAPKPNMRCLGVFWFVPDPVGEQHDAQRVQCASMLLSTLCPPPRPSAAAGVPPAMPVRPVERMRSILL